MLLPLALVPLAVGLLRVPEAAPPPDPGPRIAVLSISLNNLHKTAPDSAFPGRLQQLDRALRERLDAICNYQVVAIDSVAEHAANRTEEYFYQHPDVAAALAQEAGADWVIIPRLNRATAWAADLQATIVRVRDSMIVSNRIVEIKGLELSPELAGRLIDRGSAWMADQLAQALDRAANPGISPPPRRCPP
jgi:hypothetical protein